MNPHRVTFLTATLGLLLAACGQLPTPTPSADDDAYALTVKIDESATPASLAQRYGGKVALFAPHAGFAVVELSRRSAQKLPRGVSALSSKGDAKLEKNKNKFSLGFGASGGGGLWAGGGGGLWAGGGGGLWAGGGGGLWAGGGGGLWAGGGGGLWAGGQYQVLQENTELWKKLQLDEVHARWDSLGVSTPVKVAVIDTGIDLAHPAFDGALVPAAEMRDFVDGDQVPQDDGTFGEGGVGHGTNVAGIVLQMAPNVKILPLRVLDPAGYGDAVNVAAAIMYAADQGAKVINLSLGSAEPSPAVTAAVRYATEQKGVFVVAAAGNENKDGANYPAAESQAPTVMGQYLIGVSSVNLQGEKSSFANYGQGVELVALGENVGGPAPQNRKAPWTGTSQATPEVAGTLALLLGSSKLNVAPGALAAALQAQTDGVSAINPDLALGSGRLNVLKVVDAVLTR